LNILLYIWHMFNTDKLNKLLDVEIVNATSTNAINKLEEPATTYGDSLSKLFDNKLTLISLIDHGVSSTYLFSLIDATSFTLTDWSLVTGIPYRTLLRYQKEDVLIKPIYTEKIFAFMEVVEIGIDVFGDAEQFREWLYNPKFVYNDQRPIDLLSSSYGKDLVITIMHRIEHGIFA